MHRKTRVRESLFNKVAGRPKTLLKIKSGFRCSPANLGNFLPYGFHRALPENCFKLSSMEILVKWTEETSIRMIFQFYLPKHLFYIFSLSLLLREETFLFNFNRLEEHLTEQITILTKVQVATVWSEHR